MSITQNINRHGNITSSEIVQLTKKDKAGSGWGQAALTYIQECNMERRLQRSVTSEIDSKPCTYGNFVEPIVFERLLGTSYSYNSQETLVHPEIDYWVGSPDGFKFQAGKKTVVDTKCPYTLKSFCALVQPLYDGLEGMDAMNALRFGYTDKNGFKIPKHPDGDKYYHQILSNACIEDCDYGELIVYCPYESELPAVQKEAFELSDPKYYFIYASPKEALPYIKDNGYYKNLNIIEFPIPQEDKDYLTEIVRKAGELLIKL